MTNKKNFFDTDELLNEVLKAESGFSLADDFADSVSEKVATRFAWQQYFKEFLIYLVALLGIGGVLIGMSFLWFGLQTDIAVSFLKSNLQFIIGALFLVVFILFADRVLLRYMIYRSSKEMI